MARVPRRAPRPARDREAEDREIKKLKDAIIKELEAPGAYWSVGQDALVTKSGTVYPREYLEDAHLTRYIPAEYRNAFKQSRKHLGR